MVVVAGGAARAGEHTCRKTKDSRDQEASGKAIKIFHGTVSKGQECERKRAAYPYCQPCEPVTGCTSEPHATQFAELHCRPTVQCGRCDGTHAVARNNSCVTYQITSAVPVKTLSRELGHERSPWASVHQAGPWRAYPTPRSSRSQTRLRSSGRGDGPRHGCVALQVTPRSAAGRPGNCAIKRMAILPASAGFKDGSDSAACSVASVNPFLSSPIGANRKASNSDPSRELEAGVLMISRSIGSSPVPGSAGRNSLCICVRNPRPRGAPARPAQCCARGHQLLGFSEQSNKA